MKREYDLAVGFGPACSCSQTLRLAGLQLLSFPFDWIVPPPEGRRWDLDVQNRADIVASGFSPGLQEEDFEYHGNHTNGKAKYYNTRYGFIFLHDFPQGVPFSESFPPVAAKYKRREKRLLELMRRARRVLVVRLDHRADPVYRTPDDGCRYVRETLSRAFPTAEFDFLLLQPDESVQVGSQTLETVEPGFFRLKFNYRDNRPSAMGKPLPRLDYTSAAVAEHFAVREYRTKAEIAAHKKAERRKRWAKYGATSAWQYRWRKFLSHFRKGALPAAS